MTSKEQCCDDRFEIINETKQYIINATNIETSPEEMNVLDSICFRLWQLGLTKRNKDKLKELTHQPTLSECIKEWEEEGYLCERTSRHFYIEEVNGNVIATFHILEKYLYTSMFINSKRLNLLTKTLKALENNNETK